MKEIREKIGNRIFELRKEAGLTQEELAEKSGCAHKTVRNIESGAFSARIDIIQKVAYALECEIKIVKSDQN